MAELGSLSKASDKLRIAQPALSRQIKLLEEELGGRLFGRSERGGALTALCEQLLQHQPNTVRAVTCTTREPFTSNVMSACIASISASISAAAS